METIQGTRIEPPVRMSRGDDPHPPQINLVSAAAMHSWWLQWVRLGCPDREWDVPRSRKAKGQTMDLQAFAVGPIYLLRFRFWRCRLFAFQGWSVRDALAITRRSP